MRSEGQSQQRGSLPAAWMTGLLCLLAFDCALGAPYPDCQRKPAVCVERLSELGIPALRERRYHTRFTPLAAAEDEAEAVILGYDSDGLKLYARLDLPPSSAQAGGYPLVVLAPGWISRDAALNWDFAADNESTTGAVRSGLVDAGFATLTVGYRGRGSVAGVPAEGMMFRDAWGNGSYLSPVFYAMDVLNAVAGLASLNRAHWTPWLPDRTAPPRFDLTRVFLWGHSQGGDVATMVLAASSGNSNYPQAIRAASVWSGNIPDRLTQANTFGPMGSALQAFMSGDGTWTGSAIGRGGEINPDFIFPWPADWIGTVDTYSQDWTWQAQQWSAPSVAAALAKTYGEMYDTLNRYVREFDDLAFKIRRHTSGRTVVDHASVVAREMPRLGAYNNAEYIDVPLALHASDRDYYSLPAWNREFAQRINVAGGEAHVYFYPGTNHALKASRYDWFSPPGTKDGARQALARDIALFRKGQFAN